MHETSSSRLSRLADSAPHSFLEIAQRVTGHRTVDIVLKHYFRPDCQDFRQTIMDAMPDLLTAPVRPKALLSASAERLRPDKADALEEALKALEAMNPRSWKKQRDTVAELIREAKEWVDRSSSDYAPASTRVVREPRQGVGGVR